MSNTAKQIVDQIGNRAFTMMGASNLAAGNDHLSFKVGQNAKRVTHITVTLDASDTYSVEFIRCNLRAKEMRKVLASESNIYADQLHALIERETGLYLSL